MAAEVTVTPETFTFTFFKADEIKQVAADVMAIVGIDRPLRLDINEATPVPRMVLEQLEPGIVLAVQGASFEHPQHPRQFGEARMRENLGVMLCRVKDRLDPAFGSPPDEADLSVAQKFAWDTYAASRAKRAGLGGREPHRRYLFRHRHGFTDAADNAFDRLWNAERLTWDEILAISADAEAARTTTPA
jgi:hypothetical protein